ncbi:hypothetical protein GEU84_006740 [Fertoebacter nigrum]|uniref:Uncharacterized protein n=1 Tax=Fertoeibacter niger TaxID=2656921 RepID=A0A8X8H6I6_9RHOB|nr:hypothetical protein [Fertoeibacter niger]NUB44071.1 hypothetical protein [Fertoeibacter niger]
MRHLRSVPGGLALVGWPPLLAATGILWLAPAPLGAAGLALARLLPDGGGTFVLLVVGTALALSPAFSWIGWLIALPVVAALLHRGWFGWLPAAATGATAGMIAAKVVGSDVAAGFGLVMLILLRGVLGLVRPAAFALPRAF